MDQSCCCHQDDPGARKYRRKRSGKNDSPYRTYHNLRSKFLLDSHNFGSSPWLFVLIIHACTNFIDAGDTIGFGIPAGETENFHKSEDPSWNLPHLGEDDDFSRENMRLFAVTGHLFNRSLVDELKVYDPNVISDGDTVKVHFPRNDLPGSRWFLYSRNDALIQGVPLSSHEGQHSFYITVVHSNSPSQSSLTLPCTIEVLPEEGALELRHNSPDRKLIIDTYPLCEQDDPITVATISLDAESKDFSHLDRVHCVRNLGTFFGLASRDMTFHSSENQVKRDRVIQSGPGNVPRLGHLGNDAPHVVLAWILGCNSDTIGDIPILDRLETTALDGSLAHTIGYDVTQWQIVNRVNRRAKRMSRTKRQVGTVPSSASIFYPPARKLPIRGENVKIMEDVKSEVTVAHLQGGRTRVSLNTIRATPVPEIPIMASRVPSRSGNQVPPATPSVTPPPMLAATDSISSSDNQPPSLFFGVPDLEASMGTYLETRIHNGAFFDAEDGTTRNLHLELLDLKTHEDVSADQTWIMFDTEAQLIYGVPDDTAVAERELILVARDSAGKSASVTFFVSVDMDEVKAPSTHRFKYIFSKAPDLESDNAHYALFGKKLTTALAKSQNDMATLTMLETGLAKNGKQRYIFWYDKELEEKTTVCNSKKIKDEVTLMIGENAVLGANRPVKEFIAKFKPEYRLKSIEIELLGPCKKHTTTITSTSANTTTAITTTTTLSTATLSKTTTTTPSTMITNLLTTTTTTTTATTSTSPQSSSTSPSRVSVKTSQAETHMPTEKTTSKTSTGPISPVLEINSLPSMSAQAGKATRYELPFGIFSHPDIAEKNLAIEMTGDVPDWIVFDPNTRSLFFMPTLEDYRSLEAHNATYKKWNGHILAKVAEGLESESLTLKVFVQQPKSAAEDKANHRFIMVINNYEMSNFRATDRKRLIYTIANIFGDSDASNLRFYLSRKGSIIFSWYNSSLSHVSPCPYNKISMLSRKMIQEDNVSLKPEVKMRLQENGFTIKSLNLSRTKWCETDENESPSPTTAVDIARAGKQGKSTTIIIIAVVVICLVILIVILVVKCRMGKPDKQSLEEKREKQEREEAAIAVGSPDMSQTPRIKKGVPIIFQDELALEPNGNSHVSPATPLIAHGEARSTAIADDVEDIQEETQFATPPKHHAMTPPTPIMSDRPPPPYVKSR